MSSQDKVDVALKGLDPAGRKGKSPSVGRKGSKSPTTRPKGSVTGRDKSSDANLMSSMMARLSRAEGALRVANDEVARQDGVIRTLRQKLQKYEAAGSPQADGELSRRCRRLERTVHQMETFLADYGMMWVGEDEDEDCDGAGTVDLGTNPSKATRPPGPVSPSDYDTILANVAELNTLAGDGVGTVAKRPDGSAKIVMPDPVMLRLYANGMMLYDGPFRPLEEPIAQSFLKDVLDGYFPAELQERYPAGVPFKAFDFRTEEYNSAAGRSFPGVGQQVGGPAKPSSLLPTTVQPTGSSNVKSMSDLDSGAAPSPQSAASLLNKLPTSVVRKGKLIDIRGDIAGQLATSVGATQVSVINTEVVEGLKKNAVALKDGAAAHRPTTPADIATLQVKSIDGKETLVLKLRFHDTIGTARRYVALVTHVALPTYDVKGIVQVHRCAKASWTELQARVSIPPKGVAR